MLNTGLLYLRIRTPQRGISWAFIKCPGHSPVCIVPGTGTMRPSPPTEVGPRLLSPCVAEGGSNTWLWYPTPRDRGLERPLWTLWMNASPSTTLPEPHPRRHAGQLQEASGLTWRLDPGLVLGHSVQRVISGAKKEAGSSIYPQLIPGTAETRGD